MPFCIGLLIDYNPFIYASVAEQIRQHPSKVSHAGAIPAGRIAHFTLSSLYKVLIMGKRKQARAARRLAIKMAGYASGQNNKSLTKFNKPGSMKYHC